PPLGKIFIKKGDQRLLFRRVTSAVGMSSPCSRRQRDGQPAPQVLHHHHRMHVRLPTYSRGVAELGCDQPDGGNHIFLPLVLALSLPQISEYRRRAQRSAPGSEILGRVRE